MRYLGAAEFLLERFEASVAGIDEFELILALGGDEGVDDPVLAAYSDAGSV